MALLRRLLKQLGLVQVPAPRKFVLDEALHPLLDSLAQQQQRSPDEMASNLVNEALSHHQANADLWSKWQSLSPREQEVAALACLGYTNRQIGARLSISPETVKTHLRKALIKFNLRTRSELSLRLQGWDFSAWGPE